MKIAICSDGNQIDSIVSSRFARAEYFAVYDSDTLAFTYTLNSAKDEGSGAGGKAAKIISDLSADIVLVPELGPKAVEALKAFEIESYQYKQGITVREALYSYFEKKLPKLLDASVKGKH